LFGLERTISFAFFRESRWFPSRKRGKRREGITSGNFLWMIIHIEKGMESVPGVEELDETFIVVET
jgi:hypothetical protein